MLDNLIAIVAPHHCSGCQKIGSLLCGNCKYDIIAEPFEACISCGGNLAGPTGICGLCTVPYQQAWCVGWRQEYLQQLIGSFKFSNARAAYVPLADLLDAHLPVLPPNTIIVPIPTVSSHIRERGYDHMMLVARRLGRQRKLPVVSHLQRATTTKQRGADRKQRMDQAKGAFHCSTRLDPEATYLLLDDVVTTGATLRYAALQLQNAGAQTIWAASISKQALD